jgi:lon-related putative ATP-dependent protease
MPANALPPDALYRRCDLTKLRFATTDELEDLAEIPGQDRAREAMRFGMGIRQPGFNLYALGTRGTGKHTMIGDFLTRVAAAAQTPQDLCYVSNFETPYQPIALRLPPGQAAKLRADMVDLVSHLKGALPGAFESEDYRNRRQVIDEEFKQRQEAAFEQLQAHGKEQNLVLIRTPVGFAFAPVKDGAVLSPEDFQKLPEEEQNKAKEAIEKLQGELEQAMRQAPVWERERRDRVRELNREVTMFSVGHVIDNLQGKYREFPEVVAYLEFVEKDIVEHFDEFLAAIVEQPKSGGDGEAPPPPSARRDDRFRRYQVNVLVDRSGLEGAPVVYEDNPTFANIVGVVEQLAQMGALISDFTLIKPGALHKANGGYLVLDAEKILGHPYAWEALKRALRSHEIRIESPGQMMNLISTVTIEPQPVPLDIKVVLVGDRRIYYLLSEHDPEFDELFKVAADFEDDMRWTTDTAAAYARLIATMVRREGLRPFDRNAVARAIEHGARMADDASKLTMRLGTLADTLREADYWAAEQGRNLVNDADVQRAIDAQRRRADRVSERSQEMIERGLVLIDTAGDRVGQINGLSVMSLGNFAFGKPTRITAKVRLGRGEVVDIERQVALGGPIHSKGVLILSAFLSARYATDHPLSLWASLVFEQSYGGVEGDSASSAELYALLSALAEVPIKQCFAVTGSVNQHGQVQVIGGVNEKIEGFFELCSVRGLTGEQGVLIPKGNIQHLMLRPEVVDAVTAGRFRVYPVNTIDEGIEILTGVPAGTSDGNGRFPDGSINRRVEDRLIALAEQRRRFATAAAQEGEA